MLKSATFPTSDDLTRKRAAIYGLECEYWSDTHRWRRSRDYADAIGAEVVEVFCDPLHSASRMDDRPGFKTMVEAAKLLLLNVVIVENDLTGGIPYISATTYEFLLQNRIELHSPLFGRWSTVHVTFSALLNGTARGRSKRRRTEEIHAP